MKRIKNFSERTYKDMSQIVITKMTKEDLLGVYEVEKNAFPIPWPISSFEEELNNMLATYLVAKIDEKIVGYVGVLFVMDECHILNIAVDSNYRRMGIATELVNELFRHCKEHQTRYVILEVRVTNIPAQKLYSKFGFKDEVLRKDYYKNPDGSREDALIMCLDF